MSYTTSPLYGRRTGQIKVQPIVFRHIHEFFPGLSQDELVKIFGAAGGVPFYLQFFDPDDTFQNMSNLEAIKIDTG